MERKSLRRPPDIFECVIVRDHSAPAVRAKLDFVSHEKLLLRNDNNWDYKVELLDFQNLRVLDSILIFRQPVPGGFQIVKVFEWLACKGCQKVCKLAAYTRDSQDCCLADMCPGCGRSCLQTGELNTASAVSKSISTNLFGAPILISSLQREAFMTKHLVVVAGNIGAGKTSLAERIGARLGWWTGYESVADNPYLADFYTDMRAWAYRYKNLLDMDCLL